MNPPVRDSGDVKGSESITLVNGDKELFLEEGCIIADRYIHMTPEDAKEYGVKNGDRVIIQIDGEKGGILNRFKLELHLDTDDGNAFNVKTGDELEVIKETK